MGSLVKRLPIPEKYFHGLDPEFRKLWDEYGAYTTRADERPVEEYRTNPASLTFTYPVWSGPDVFRVEDFQVPVMNPDGFITVRVYAPEGTGPFPVHINTHGGGWTVGGLTSEAAWCREICNRARVVVADVDYRLSPEVRFPVALYDSWTAVKWVISNAEELNINPKCISLGGLSAGGQMTAVLAHFARDENIELRLQLMTVAATDFRQVPLQGQEIDPSCPYESFVTYKDVPWGPLGRLQWFMDHWIGPDPERKKEAFSNWLCSPILAPSFKNLAPAFIVTAEFDPARDEAEYYGKVMKENGNQVEIKRYPGMPHAFAHYNHPGKGLSQSRQYIADTARAIMEAHHTSMTQGVEELLDNRRVLT